MGVRFRRLGNETGRHALRWPLLPLHVLTADRMTKIDVGGGHQHVNSANGPLDLSHFGAGDHAFGHPSGAQGGRKGNGKDNDFALFMTNSLPVSS